MARVYSLIEAKLLDYAQLKNWSLLDLEKDGVITIEAPVTRSGGDYVIRITEELGKKLHHQSLSVAMATKE